MTRILAKYPNCLRKTIKCSGLTVKEVAEETNIPLRTLFDYCSGKIPVPRKRLEDIATMIGCSPSELVPAFSGESSNQLSTLPHNNAFTPLQDIMEQGSTTEEFYMDQLRRNLLHLLGTAGVMLPFSESAFDWMRKVVTESPQLDAEAIRNLATVNKCLWNLYKPAASKSFVLDGALGHIKTLLYCLRESHNSSSYRNVSALASDMSQLIGEIFFDRQELHAAATCYTFAITAAKDAEDYDLWACALARYAFLPIYSGQYKDAIVLMQSIQFFAWRNM